MLVHLYSVQPTLLTNILQVSSVTLLSEGQDINFSKEVKSVADEYTIG